MFNPRQQAALAFARRLTLEPGAVGDADIAKLKRHFTDAEIIELTFAIARFNAVNRWTDALGLPLEGHVSGDAPAMRDAPTGSAAPQMTSVVTQDAHMTPAPLPSAEEIVAAIDACRNRAPRVELPSNAAAAAAMSGVVHDRQPLLWERALASLPVIGRTHVLVWNTILGDEHLTPRLKSELAYLTAVHNRAWYAAGTARRRLKELGATDDEIAAIVGDDDHRAAGVTAAYQLARKLTVEPQRITDHDVSAVQSHYSDAEIAQIIQVICLANLFDRFTEPLGLPLETP
jgi:alkylhydroperoxidase family enzyme